MQKADAARTHLLQVRLSSEEKQRLEAASKRWQRPTSVEVRLALGIAFLLQATADFGNPDVRSCIQDDGGKKPNAELNAVITHLNAAVRTLIGQPLPDNTVVTDLITKARSAEN